MCFSTRSLTPSPGPASPMASPKRTTYTNRAYRNLVIGGGSSSSGGRSVSNSPNHVYSHQKSCTGAVASCSGGTTASQMYPHSPLVLPTSPLASSSHGAPVFPTSSLTNNNSSSSSSSSSSTQHNHNHHGSHNHNHLLLNNNNSSPLSLPHGSVSHTRHSSHTGAPHHHQKTTLAPQSPLTPDSMSPPTSPLANSNNP